MVGFKQLWGAHATIAGENDPCSTDGKANFPDQCAIRVGVALARCNVKTASIPGATHCWHHEHRKGHILRAEELAKGLTLYPIAGISRVQKLTPEGYSAAIRGRTGIIFFKDYWRRSHRGREESFRNRSGDHIDLWNGSRLTDWTSWVRVRFGLTIPGVWSDLEDSKGIWFWQVM